MLGESPTFWLMHLRFEHVFGWQDGCDADETVSGGFRECGANTDHHDDEMMIGIMILIVLSIILFFVFYMF